MHFFLFYLPTFAMGMWRHTLFLLLTGPILGRLLTEHHDEIPASECASSPLQTIAPPGAHTHAPRFPSSVWCYFSIIQVMAPLAYGWWLDRSNRAAATISKKSVTNGAGTAICKQLPRRTFLSPVSSSPTRSPAGAASRKKAAKAAAAAKQETELEDVTGGYTGMALKCLGFAGCLVLKRVLTDYVMVGADGYNDLAAQAAN